MNKLMLPSNIILVQYKNILHLADIEVNVTPGLDIFSPIERSTFVAPYVSVYARCMQYVCAYINSSVSSSQPCAG